jgi:signal transduction histidine kinase
VWRTWWFLGATGAICAGGIWGLARYISERRLRQQLLAVEQRHAMDRERSRIAKDMHDQLGSKLTRISFLSELAQRPTAAQSNGLAAKEVAVSARELLASLDALVWAVNPRNDSLENLVGYLDRHAKEYFLGTNIECEVKLPAELPSQIVTAEVRHNVFRSFEEALNNVLKHSQAHKVWVKMLLKSNTVEIVVQDDGIGISAEAQTNQRNGLKNMCARMETIGGICEVSSQPHVGTKVIFRFAILETKSQVSDKLLATTTDEHQSHHR